MASTLTRLQFSGFLPVAKTKTLVYAAPVFNEEAFHLRIADAFQTVNNYPSIFKLVRQSIA
jgi:hypothetical protein